MRIAAISDVHGNVYALTSVLAALASDDVDILVNLGDHLSGGIAPAATADLLMTTPAISVRGNHERQLLETPPMQMSASDRLAHDEIHHEHRQWLRTLPMRALAAPGVLAFHGSPDDDLEYLLETVTPAGARPATPDEVERRLSGYLAFDLLLCGHTHLQRSMRLDAGPLIVNPGSVGWPAYADEHPHPHVMESGSPHARYAIIDDRSGQWEVEFRAVTYPWDEAAASALEHGRDDIHHAILTGRALRA